MFGTRARRSLVAAAVISLVLPLGATARDPQVTRAPEPDASALVPAVVAGLDFGQVQVGTTSVGQDYVYTNGTAGDLTVSVSLAGANTADFAIASETCTATPIPAAGTCTVTVTFTPTAEYGRAATLEVADSQPAQVSVPLAGVGLLPDSKVTWGRTYQVGSAYTWSEGTALARTVSGSTQYLHAVVQRYDVARYGIYYRRSTGTTWPYGTRLNPTTQYAERSTIAAAGTYVYAAWSSYAKASPSGTQPRVLYFRSNKANGSGSWGTIKRLTSSTGRIDFPRMAASGTRVYVTYTDAATGSVKIQVSKDRGATWRAVSLGTTTRSGTWGKYGLPVVAAAGATVAVAWISSASGTVKFKWSSDYGVTWKSASTLGTGAEVGSWPSIAALGSRVAVAWTGASAMVVRVRSGSTWSQPRVVLPSAGSTNEYEWPWNGQVVLNGTTRVGIAWEACWAGCADSDPDSAFRGDLLWRESANNGASWARSQVVGAADFDYTDYYYPSVLWPSASSRYVMASRWYAPNQLENVAIRAGTGAP